MSPHIHNDLKNFIAGWYIEPVVCDHIIQNYKQLQSQGYEQEIKNDDFGYNWIEFSDLEKKVQDNYMYSISRVCNEYKIMYDRCSLGQHNWEMVHTPNLQRYKPNNYYKIWHAENNGTPSSFHRHLVFMTYLNDVIDGGETEFLYQNLKIKPEKGLTLVWPAGWTHTHRGCPAKNEEKFIITGWFSYNFLNWTNP